MGNDQILSCDIVIETLREGCLKLRWVVGIGIVSWTRWCVYDIDLYSNHIFLKLQCRNLEALL